MEKLPIVGQLKKDEDTALSRFTRRAVVDRREGEDSAEMALLGNEQGFELLVGSSL